MYVKAKKVLLCVISLIMNFECLVFRQKLSKITMIAMYVLVFYSTAYYVMYIESNMSMLKSTLSHGCVLIIRY